MLGPYEFHPFDPHRAVVTYRHNLPHWRQDGATYFVTFRLGDSIPATVLSTWQEEREIWARAHGVNAEPISADWKRQFASIPVLERTRFQNHQHQREIETLNQCLGQCLLRDPKNAQLVSNALRFFHDSRCWTGDFMIMPNHVHLLLTPANGHALEDLMHSIKRHSSRQINKRSNARGRLWQRENYDHIVRDRKELSAYRRYIADNPRKARLGSQQFILHHSPDLNPFT